MEISFTDRVTFGPYKLPHVLIHWQRRTKILCDLAQLHFRYQNLEKMFLLKSLKNLIKFSGKKHGHVCFNLKYYDKRFI